MEEVETTLNSSSSLKEPTTWHINKSYLKNQIHQVDMLLDLESSDPCTLEKVEDKPLYVSDNNAKNRNWCISPSSTISLDNITSCNSTGAWVDGGEPIAGGDGVVGPNGVSGSMSGHALVSGGGPTIRGDGGDGPSGFGGLIIWCINGWWWVCCNRGWWWWG